MRKIWTWFFILWSLASADLAAQVDHIELGYQTTKRGIVWYRPGLPTHVPYWQFSRDTNAVMWHDTLTAIRYDWDYSDDRWRAKGTFSGPLPPPAQATSGSALIDYRTAYWIRDTFNLLHKYDSTANAWTPWGDWFYMASAPTDIAAGGSNGAAKYTRSLWQDSDDNLVRYWDGDSWELLGTGAESDVITLADSAALKAYTGIARGVVLRQQGREGLFTQTTTSRAHDGYMVFEDGAARKWIRITEQDFINVKWFGAIGNGVADDQYAIQRAIDYTIYEDTTIKKVYLPKGKYLISAPLQMGYGAGVSGNFSSVSLLGDGTPPFRGEAGYAGTIIETNYSNAPAVNIQGARNSSIDNITFIGLNDITGGLSDTSSANINNWLDSGLHANANTRYAPYAAITVDAYSGTAPGTPYPNVTYPSYSGVSGQYSKAPSSHVKIRNVHIYEFVAGIVIQPNADANGDFVQIEKAIIESCAYGISVGNSQSRNMRITDGYINAHTCITNSTHGAQVGRLTMIENVHFGGYQWFNLGSMPYVDGLQVNACYGESFYWIGQFGVGIAGAFPPITFNSCRFQFGSLDSRTLSNAGAFTGNVAYMFNGCSFSGGRIYVFENNQLANLHFRQCTFSSTTDAGEVGVLPSYYQYFYRSFGFVMSTYPQRTNVEQCRFFENGSAIGSPFPLTTGDGTAMPELMEYTSYWKKLNITGKDVQFADLGYSYDSYLGVGSAFSSTSITNRDFTGTLAAGFNKGIGIGDLLLFNYSNNTLLVMVDSIAGSTVTGVTMNGYMYDGSGNYTNSLFSTTVTGGNIFHISARKFINSYTITGDFVVGSTTVSNIKYTYNNSNASSAFIKHTPLMNADNFSGMTNWPVTDACYIDSVDTANNRFFLSAAAVEAGTFVIQNCLLSEGDNLGDHHLRKNLRTKDNWISNDGDNECLYPTTNARVGVNTSNPGAVVEITGAAGLFGAYVNSSSTNVGNGYTYNGGTLASQIAFDFLGAPSSEIYGQIRSTGTGSALALIQTQNSNTGADPYLRFVTNSGGATWHIGIDNSDSDKLKIGQTGAPTTAINAAITVTTADLVGISQRIPVRTLHVEGEVRITDLTTDPPTRLVGADADGDLGAVALTGLTIAGGTLIANDTSPTNEIQRLDTFEIVSNTLRASLLNDAVPFSSVSLAPYLDNTDDQVIDTFQIVSNILRLSLESDGQPFKSVDLTPILTGGLNGIYGDGTAGSGSDTLPTGGSTVTIPGQWQPLQFNADTDAGETWTALRVNAATCTDDRITKYLVGKSPSDSLEIYGYDRGSLLKATGGQLTMQTDKELINIADSIYMATVPEKTTLGGIVGFTQFGSYLSQIKGTATDQVLKWNNTGAGYWYPGTASGGTLTGAENGLNVVSNKVRLGGNLLTTTSIEGDNNELRFFDGKLSVSSWTGFANTPVQPIRFQGQEADPTTSASPTLDGIIEYRLHSSIGSDQSNSMTIGGFANDADGMWMQSRSATVPNVKYALSLQPRGGLFSVGRMGALDAVATFAGSALTGSTITGNVMHLENTGGNAKAAMGMGVGTDVLDSEVGYFDGADALRVTNRNATTGTSSVRIAVGGETSDKVIVIGSSVTPNARMGVGHTATTTIKSTIDNKGSYAAAVVATTGNLTLTEAHHTVRYTLNASPTFTLPSAVDCPGREYIIHHFGSAGNIILSQNVISSTGTTFNTIPARNWAYIQSDGADWYGYRLQSL